MVEGQLGDCCRTSEDSKGRPMGVAIQRSRGYKGYSGGKKISET